MGADVELPASSAAAAPPSASSPAPPSSPASSIAPAPQGLTGPTRRLAGVTNARNGRQARLNRKSASSKVRLKDMLGFSDASEAPAAPAPSKTQDVPPEFQMPPVPSAAMRTLPPALALPPASTRVPVRPGPPALTVAPTLASATPAASAPPVMPATPAASAPPAMPAAPEPAMPAGSISEGALQRALEAALHSFVQRESEAESMEPDLLSGSPVFNVKARPVKHRVGETEDTFRTPTAVAVAAIATELATHNVPESQLVRTRTALLDLAVHLDHHDLNWQTLREAVVFIMEYPTVARRVLPLLLPFLEQAA
jgi:hypothetical protein